MPGFVYSSKYFLKSKTFTEPIQILYMHIYVLNMIWYYFKDRYISNYDTGCPTLNSTPVEIQNGTARVRVEKGYVIILVGYCILCTQLCSYILKISRYRLQRVYRFLSSDLICAITVLGWGPLKWAESLRSYTYCFHDNCKLYKIKTVIVKYTWTSIYGCIP